MSPEEFEAFMREAEAFQDELLRVIERKKAAADAADARRLKRRRLLGFL